MEKIEGRRGEMMVKEMEMMRVGGSYHPFTVLLTVNKSLTEEAVHVAVAVFYSHVI